MVGKKEMVWVFSIGAAGYVLLELIWRGYSHWTMALAGGLSFCGIHLTNQKAKKLSIWRKGLLGAAWITLVELYTGIVVNLWLHWKVWDYSGMPFHFLGQICPQFSLLWLLITFPLLALSRQIGQFFRLHPGWR